MHNTQSVRFGQRKTACDVSGQQRMVVKRHMMFRSTTWGYQKTSYDLPVNNV
ncbi:hypothetical protein AVEN_208352-1, partial [Araneus ventricosus]